MEAGTIYGLYDPREPDRIRYVGLTTKTPLERLRSHKYSARHATKPEFGRTDLPIYRFFRSRESAGVEVAVRTIESDIPEALLGDRESFWIAHYRSIGQADLNILDGGERGWAGGSHSEASRRKMSKAKKGRLWRESGGPNAKLNRRTVEEIRETRARQYVPVAEISRKYGITNSAVWRILSNTTWFDPNYDPSSLAPSGKLPGQSNTVLSPDEVREIRAIRLREWVPARTLAEKYGCSQATIDLVLLNKTWRDPNYDPSMIVRQHDRRRSVGE